MKPLLSANVRPVGYETWRIAWITESYANISEYRLLYRKVPVSSCVTNNLSVYIVAKLLVLFILLLMM
jgi:hypothetical protein